MRELRPQTKLRVLDKLTYAGNLRNLDRVKDDIEMVIGDIADATMVRDAMAEHRPGGALRRGEPRRSLAGKRPAVRAHQRRGDAGAAGRGPAVWACGASCTSPPTRCTVPCPRMRCRPWRAIHSIPAARMPQARPAQSIWRSATTSPSAWTWSSRGSNSYGPYQFPEKIIPLFIAAR